MLVPDEIRKCVVFLYYDDMNGVRRAAGTAFFVGLERPHDSESHWVYLVTAKHVLDGIRANSENGIAFVRCNLRAGGFTYAVSDVDNWATHPDETVIDDVAVIAWVPPVDMVDYIVYTLASAANETTGHGVGDEVFFPGLFVNHAGR